MASFPGQLG